MPTGNPPYLNHLPPFTPADARREHEELKRVLDDEPKETDGRRRQKSLTQPVLAGIPHIGSLQAQRAIQTR